MKLYPKGASNEKDFAALKDKASKDVEYDADIYASNATKKLDDEKVIPISKPYTIPIRDAPRVEEQNSANRGQRHNFLYERRMDRGLFCALALIIALCLLGMATSIGGALYLKYRHNHGHPQSLNHSAIAVSVFKFYLSAKCL